MSDTDNNDETGTGATGGGSGANAATAMQRDESHGGAAPVEGQEGVINHATAGEAFTGWFNEKLALLPNPTIMLGTKPAHAVKLHPDGRLECVLSGVEGEGAIQFVAFETQYLDQLVRKIGAIGL